MSRLIKKSSLSGLCGALCGLVVFSFVLFLREPALSIEKIDAVNPEQNSRGTLEVDLPFTVQMNQAFHLDIWLMPSDPGFSETVKIFMEQTDKMLYEPRVFQLKPRNRQTVRATVIQSRSGLAEVRASADWWEDYYIAINAGFSAKLRSISLDKSIESGSIKSFTLDFVDNHGKEIALDAPVALALQASKANIRGKETDPWTDKIDLEIRQGASSSPLIQLQPDAWSLDTGLLQAQVRINDDLVVLHQNIPFTVIPRWWLPLLMAILGGVLYSSYKIMKERSNWFLKITSGALAGALAYFMTSWDILGIQVDTTSLRGFVVLGFLFSYLGIEQILKRAVPTKR